MFLFLIAFTTITTSDGWQIDGYPKSLDFVLGKLPFRKFVKYPNFAIKIHYDIITFFSSGEGK